MRLIFMLLLISILSTGCGPFSPAYYQPPEPAYTSYKKEGSTELDVKKSMLECGTAPITERNEDMNTFILADWCMERMGYRSTLSRSEGCKLEHNKQYPACQPGAVIPKPSVERRLNSEYCKSAREMISENNYQSCLKNEAATYERVTEEDCAAWYKDLTEECRP